MILSPLGVSVHVRDTGIGISPEELDQVFERFYRGNNATVLHSDGLGLGLPVAKAIVEAHGGDIIADSQLDQGTTITVTLPTLPTVRKQRTAA